MPSLARSMTAGRSFTNVPRSESEEASVVESGLSAIRHPRVSRKTPFFSMNSSIHRTGIEPALRTRSETCSIFCVDLETYLSRLAEQVPVVEVSGLAGDSPLPIVSFVVRRTGGGGRNVAPVPCFG